MKSAQGDRRKGRLCISTKDRSWTFAGTRHESGFEDMVGLTYTSAQDGTKIFSGGADNAGRMFDVTTGQPTQVAAHDAPIKAVRWVDAPGTGILATGSWDKTIKVSLSQYHCRITHEAQTFFSSTGIYEAPLLSLLSNFQKDATPLMYNTLSWSLVQQSAISKYST